MLRFQVHFFLLQGFLYGDFNLAVLIREQIPLPVGVFKFIAAPTAQNDFVFFYKILYFVILEISDLLILFCRIIIEFDSILFGD